ncbi:phage protein Gp37 [Snodgrassella sp. CFCC 13594]|uniref:phage protein Gp37 n=1 Tax=Snodgrassella sp. CFCC 13594 TaxID=1775559 RepID=UPI000A584E82|nr:phage protein Gp37 [Snodgrassella sp. CFCC 13594]
MVRQVKSYGGELDNENWANAIKQVPCCWVTYGGAKIDTKSTSKQLYEQTATMVVMAASRSLRSELAGRQGGLDKREVGSNDLIFAVLRLLSGQRLDEKLNSFGLVPKKVRTILNNAVVQNGALSVVAIEFEATWNFTALESGRFPEETTDKANPDYVFTQYQGELSDPYPEFLRMDSLIFDDKLGAQVHSELRLNEEQP